MQFDEGHGNPGATQKTTVAERRHQETVEIGGHIQDCEKASGQEKDASPSKRSIPGPLRCVQLTGNLPNSTKISQDKAALMLNIYQIAAMNDSQMNELLKTLLIRYVKQKQDWTSLDLLNALMSFALEEGIIELQNDDHKNLVANRLMPKLVECRNE